MEMDYPNNPSYGQLFTSGSFTWIWDGQKWASGLGAPVLSVAGRTGNVILTSADITDWAAATPFVPLAGGNMSGPLLISASGDSGSSTAHAGFTNTRWRFAVVAGADPAAGTIDYRGYDGSAVNIVGAGASAGNRLVHIFDNLTTGTINSGAINSGALSATGTIHATSDISTPGNVMGTNSVQSNGVYFQNNSGNFYSPQSIVSGGNLTANGGVVYIAGMYWQNNGGYMYTPWSIHTSNSIQVDGNVGVNGQINHPTGTFYNPGDNWLYFNGSFRAWDVQSNNNFSAPNGSLYCGGLRWVNNGGWMYTDQGMWCANINTGSIQCNSNAINGVTTVATNGTTYGGWGCQFNWINGNWYAFAPTDAIYFYTNQGYVGGTYYDFCDERMKWNFKEVTRDCLAAINAIELRGFDFSEGPPRQRRTNLYETRPEFFLWEDLPRIVKHIETGFIAQQLREIIPEAVPDPPEEGAYLSVDMRPLVATLIGAVQQLTARLKAVEGR